MAAPAHEFIPADAYRLNESAALNESVVAADGTVEMHLIRPCIGRGRGRHLYEADMLANNAKVFSGWRMFIDHLAPSAKKMQEGLPRSIRDLGGRILESWWDPDVPADPSKGYGQGAVVGKARPVGIVRALIEEDPELLEASISATATGVRRVVRDGQSVWLVEGIDKQGSVDFVSEGGAGGRINALQEAVYSNEEEVQDMLDTLSNEELTEYLRENRSELVEALVEEGGSPTAEDETVLDEAALRSYVESIVEAKLAEALSEREDQLRAEGRAEAQRQIDLRDMRDAAHRLINESRLPETWQADLKDEYDLKEGKPTPKLNVTPVVDEESGAVTKTAMDVLTEAVRNDIKAERQKLAEAKPTRVTGQGPTRLQESATPPADTDKDAPAEALPYYAQVLQEAGVKDPVAAYRA